MKRKQKRREEYAVRFIEIDFLLPDWHEIENVCKGDSKLSIVYFNE
ncbi:MAG: hypothetical protein WA941_21485 [Nitrososphaeraceae archaeon]